MTHFQSIPYKNLITNITSHSLLHHSRINSFNFKDATSSLSIGPLHTNFLLLPWNQNTQANSVPTQILFSIRQDSGRQKQSSPLPQLAVWTDSPNRQSTFATVVGALTHSSSLYLNCAWDQGHTKAKGRAHSTTLQSSMALCNGDGKVSGERVLHCAQWFGGAYPLFYFRGSAVLVLLLWWLHFGCCCSPGLITACVYQGKLQSTQHRRWWVPACLLQCPIDVLRVAAS